MKKNIWFFFILFFEIIGILQVFAVPAHPYPIKVIQPDGSEITIRMKGDEFYHYHTTLDGYPIKKDKDGYFKYAKVDKKGKFSLTKMIAREIDKRSTEEKEFIKNIPQKINYQQFNLSARAQRISRAPAVASRQYPLTGNPKSLVILVNFSDNNFTISQPQAAFTNLLNQQGYSENEASGSARDYFRDASNGVFAPQFDVVGPYTLPNNMEYYGANGSDGYDKNPRQMIIDACRLADENGIDFSQYDTDHDGFVDNIFVYYAGYNEAEGASENTIWPHRWTLADTRTKFDGVIIFDYACSSELRSSMGTNMCGIGTFCHEFGHVLGLPDYYNTDNSDVYTLSVWNIMDAGAYLNNGKTPPTYAAFDRFYLNWLIPEGLKSPQNVTLEALTSSNQAFLISQYGNHNLIGNNPSPVEFFMLENRQLQGWDTYLPGHGMLITHIYYNASDWENNSPNNNMNAMGYDIVEADEMASEHTRTGDPFPGSSNVTSFSPVLRSGININKPLTNIKEQNGFITFNFIGVYVPIINVGKNNFTPFQTVQRTPTTPQEIKVYGKNLKDTIHIYFSENNHFEMKLATEEIAQWRKHIELIPNDSIVDTTTVLIRYNPIVPSYIDKHYETLLFQSTDADTVKISLVGSSTPYLTVPEAFEPSEITTSSYIANWASVNDATGYYLTAYMLSEGTSILTESFDNGLTVPQDWLITAKTLNNTAAYVGKASPSIQLSNSEEMIQTEKYVISVNELSFFVGLISGNVKILIEAYDGVQWQIVDTLSLSNSFKGIKSYSFNEVDNFIQFRLTYLNGTGSAAIDDVSVSFLKKIEFNVKNKWVTVTSDTIINLFPDTECFYKVRASDKTYLYENITDYSNTISLRTEKDTEARKLRVKIHEDNSITVYVPQTNTMIYIYDAMGRTIATYLADYNIINIDDLKNRPRGQVYIIQAGNRRTKILL